MLMVVDIAVHTCVLVLQQVLEVVWEEKQCSEQLTQDMHRVKIQIQWLWYDISWLGQMGQVGLIGSFQIPDFLILVKWD